MKIFNTQTKKKEEFEPLEEGKVGIYLCGPTVYDLAHLGHGRSATAFDVIRKYFVYQGYDVKFVSNYTDIDDKMIKRAAEENISVAELTKKIVPEYEQDYEALGIEPPDVIPYATEHVEEMIEFVKMLEQKGLTYVLDDGVYFAVKKHEAYGELSGQSLEDLQMGARVAVNEKKESPYDFVLWKFKKEGEPSWPAPWGEGRPGWHIECSAMSHRHLGEKFDVHGGGLDLVFPHHECEVAQTKGVFGPDSFAKYWMHNGFIQVDNEKMSKSLGNFFTLRDIFQKYDPQVVRFMFLQTHYRNPINFSDALLEQSKAGLARLHDFVRNLSAFKERSADDNSEVSTEITELIDDCREGFEASMSDDFETSGALGSVFEFVKAVNILMGQEAINRSDCIAVWDFLHTIDAVLGVIFFEEENLDDEVEKLIAERAQARADKDFARADQIRDDLLERGIMLDDTAEGTIWKKV